MLNTASEENESTSDSNAAFHLLIAVSIASRAMLLPTHCSSHFSRSVRSSWYSRSRRSFSRASAAFASSTCDMASVGVVVFAVFDDTEVIVVEIGGG